MKAYNFRYDNLTVKTYPSILFISDIHFDSEHCDRNLLTKHLRYCQQNNIDVFVLGDLFDCMGGKYDKRTNKEDIRPEYQKRDYFNVIVEDATEYLRKFDCVKFISEGNHETSVRRRHEIDLTRMICQNLNIQNGAYRGFITVNTRREGGDGKKFVLYYSHGHGGGAPVTKGVIQTNRRSDSIDADLYLSGHLHTDFNISRHKWVVDKNNNIIKKSIKHLQLGTYLQSLSQYADEREHTPSSSGGWLVKFLKRSGVGWTYEVKQLEH